MLNSPVCHAGGPPTPRAMGPESTVPEGGSHDRYHPRTPGQGRGLQLTASHTGMRRSPVQCACALCIDARWRVPGVLPNGRRGPGLTRRSWRGGGASACAASSDTVPSGPRLPCAPTRCAPLPSSPGRGPSRPSGRRASRGRQRAGSWYGPSSPRSYVSARLCVKVPLAPT